MSAARVTLAVATLLVGLAAGFFFTYEASVTLGLAEVDDVTYVRTFQAINETVRNAWFGIVFFGSVPALVVAVAANRREPAVRLALIGASLVLHLATITVTATGNLPLNDDLASYEQVDATSAAAARADFESDWNRFNLIRALTSGASFACLVACARGVVRDDEA
ncbi:MAG: DUF1772 domain-containing protein [Ilumatobacter sp.]|uniref:anthrone oxygenase family protein n=1 Tax=Ilumatobacter sp. TaxID=1967498 RepID=UPI002605EF9A|nr:DUF1772 domain-containing protein [Ilumatobacter sp.]MDJ0767862.1 DUF1772 domain-containing protein [Ilumatobacter sp.]